MGLKWCPKANREQVGFWGRSPPNSFTAKINQFKLLKNSHQHINNLSCRVNSLSRTLHKDFYTALKYRDKFWTHVLKSMAPLRLTSGLFPHFHVFWAYQRNNAARWLGPHLHPSSGVFSSTLLNFPLVKRARWEKEETALQSLHHQAKLDDLVSLHAPPALSKALPWICVLHPSP